MGRIIISSNRKFADQFSYWMGGRRAMRYGEGIELVVEPTVHNGNKFGAIKGIKYAIERAGIREDLMVIAGDNLYDSGVMKAVEHFGRAGRHPTVYVHDVGSEEEARRFGVVEIGAGNRITGFEEKPEEPRSTLVSTGIYIYPKEVLGMFDEYLSDRGNPDAPGYFLQWLIGKTEVDAVVNGGRWYDVGTLETYSTVYREFGSRPRS